MFRNDVEDYIELVNFGPPVCSVLPGAGPGCPPVPIVTIPINSFSMSQYQNIGNARIEGVEFEGTYDAGDWFVGLSGQHIRGRDVTNNLPLLTVQPDQIATTFGVRLFERKLTMSVRWQAVAAKPASEFRTATRTACRTSHRSTPTIWSTSTSAISRRRISWRASASITCSTSTTCST